MIAPAWPGDPPVQPQQLTSHVQDAEAGAQARQAMHAWSHNEDACNGRCTQSRAVQQDAHAHLRRPVPRDACAAGACREAAGEDDGV